MPANATEIGQRRQYTYHGKRYPSVTTLLKAWPQEWAIAYGAKHVAMRAVADPQHLAHLVERQGPEYATRWLKAAPFERRDAAADAGTMRHGYLEDRLNGYAVPDGPLSATETAVEQFLAVYRPEPLYVEAQVVSVAEGYAGSADAFLRIYGKTYVFDLKTSGHAATDHKTRLQLAAYRYADVVFEDDRDLGPVPVCDGALVLAIPRDTPEQWQLIETPAGPQEYARFLDFKRAWLWYDEHKDTGIGELLLPQTREDVA